MLAGDESLPPPGVPSVKYVMHQLTQRIVIPYFREVWKNHYIFHLNLYMVLTVTSIWCCLGKMLTLILLSFRHLDWIWTVEDWDFLFCLIGNQVLWFGCLPLTEWQLGHDLGAFYFVPYLIPGRPFSPCVMSQVTLMGKAVVLSAKTGSQPWENRSWHMPWSQWTNLQPWPIFSWKSIRWPYFPQNKSGTLYSSSLLLVLKSRGPHPTTVWAVLISWPVLLNVFEL